MENKPYVPDAELLAFAKDFSDRYKDLRGYGDIYSENNKYHIMFNSNVPTFAGMGHNRGRMEFNLAKLNNVLIGPEFVFFMVLWLPHNLLVLDLFECDKAVLDYLKNHQWFDAVRRQIIMGFGYMCETAPSATNQKRLEAITDLICDTK